MDKNRETLMQIKNNINKVILGKDEVIDLLFVSLISSGHVLLEDVPGVGKTTLAKTLAKSINCDFKRIQFTPDLLPTDLTGVNVYNQKIKEFEFNQGPLFTNILLADEINRATPRTQSSLLECMEERQVTVDGNTYTLEDPFLVIATQNPIENYGTFPLPEAQLDRFFMKIKIGYPERKYENQILDLFNTDSPLESLAAVCDANDILSIKGEISKIHVDEEIKEYILNITYATRDHEMIELGASPRAALALYRGSQSYAYLNERSYVTPDDIKYLTPFILSHRIILKGASRFKNLNSSTILNEILKTIPVPLEEVN